MKNHLLQVNGEYPKNLFWQKSRIYLPFCLTFCACLNLACQRGQPVSSTPARSNQPKSLKSEDPVLPAHDSPNTIKCDILSNRLDELDSLILRQQQAAKQALTQSKESCLGNSAVDCNFWTGRTDHLNGEVRELRQQYQKLTEEKSELGCPF